MYKKRRKQTRKNQCFLNLFFLVCGENTQEETKSRRFSLFVSSRHRHTENNKDKSNQQETHVAIAW